MELLKAVSTGVNSFFGFEGTRPVDPDTLKRMMEKEREERVHSLLSSVRMAQHETGDPLAREIAKVIENRQSVLLTGPRGCGKTWLITKALQLASRDLVHSDHAFLQGNSEMPRSVLFEDEMTVRLDQNSNARTIWMNPATFLQFATRSPHTNAIVLPEDLPTSTARGARDPKRLGWKMRLAPKTMGTDEDTYVPFVVVLDEVNRFPGGVLDSLLSVLEEKVMVVQGRHFEVPAIVVMTANPPGYDLTARPLSPPLLARIERTWELMLPTLETQVDQIIPDAIEASPLGLRGRTELRNHQPLIELAVDAIFCMWGNPGAIETRVSLNYMPDTTRERMREIRKIEHVADLADSLASLTNYGPDGRTAAQWIKSAMAVHPEKKLDVDTLMRVLTSVVNEKASRNYNVAQSADKVVKQAKLMTEIARRVLSSGVRLQRQQTRTNEIV